MTIFLLRWFRRPPAPKPPEPPHVKRLVRAGVINIAQATVSAGKRLSP